jgi:hypothetical protein
MSVDEISLTLPADEAFHRVAHLVLGGLAVRLEVTYEHLEDIELALDTLLERRDDDGDVTVRLQVGEGELRTLVGPFGKNVLNELEHDVGEGLDLRRILEAVCDGVEVSDPWIELTKRINGGR